MSGPDIIAILQAQGLASTVTIEPYQGEGGDGPVYGPPVQVVAYVDHGRRMVRDAAGEEVVSEATVIHTTDLAASPKSRVTLAGGQVGHVAVDKQHNGGGLPTPDHTELALGGIGRR